MSFGISSGIIHSCVHGSGSPANWGEPGVSARRFWLTLLTRQAEQRKAFVSWARLDVNYRDVNYRDFCDSVTVPGNTVNWRFAKTYHPGTPEEVEFVLQLSNNAATYDKAACLESLDRLINSCDGNNPENPMNWKFGGKWVRGGYSWEIHPKKNCTSGPTGRARAGTSGSCRPTPSMARAGPAGTGARRRCCPTRGAASPTA